MAFRVDLDTFRGPLDLLLFLVRKHEIPITEISLATVTDQFMAHLDVLQDLDVNAAGDFLEIASTLVEMKSKVVLPTVEEAEEQIEDPHNELVQRLLDYKKYRDASSLLEDRSREWQQHCRRVANDVPERRVDPAEQPIREIELWDLVSAFGRVIRERRATATSSIVYDDTPIQVYMRRIHGNLLKEGRVAFSELFESGMHKSAMIGVFLAILELVRHHGAVTDQQDGSAEIWVLPGENFAGDFAEEQVDNYDGQAASDEASEPDES